MRQTGNLAAAGIYVLNNHIERLTEDHERTKRLEDVIGKLSFVEEMMPIETNIIVFKIDAKAPSDGFMNLPAENGVLVVPFGKQTIRMVTHLNFTDDQLERSEDILSRLF